MNDVLSHVVVFVLCTTSVFAVWRSVRCSVSGDDAGALTGALYAICLLLFAIVVKLP